MAQFPGALLVLALAVVASADRLTVRLGSVAPFFRVTLNDMAGRGLRWLVGK
jgi:hypothetical protein